MSELYFERSGGGRSGSREPGGRDGGGAGDGLPLVLMGSLGTDLSMWEPQLVLGSRFELIRIDHPGHGGSTVPNGGLDVADIGRGVIGVLDELGIARANFAGVSLGGMVGLWLAAFAPERIAKLIAICTAAHTPNGDAFRERAAAVRAAGSAASIAPGVVANWLTEPYADAHPRQRKELIAMISAMDPNGYAACCEAVGALDLRPSLAQIKTPTLVLSGAQDRALPVALQEEIVAAVPGARHEILDPGAHIVTIEQAAAVNRLIGEFLV